MTFAPTIAIVGSVLTDLVVDVPHMPRSGQNLHVPRMDISPGGKGANAAITLARHGARVFLISNTGADALGEQLRQQLETIGVSTNLLGRHPSQATGVVIMLTEPNGQTSYVAHPAASMTVTAAEVRQRLRPLLSQLDALLFNLEAPEPALLAAVELAEEAGVPLFVDAGPERGYSPRLWRAAHILSPNEPETATLVGHPLPDDESAARAAQTLLKQGPETVVLKLGARGALLATADTVEVAPAFPIHCVDPAGAGDAFTAGLVWACLGGYSLAEAVRWANACGALAASRFGTAPVMPSRPEVAQFLEERSVPR